MRPGSRSRTRHAAMSSASARPSSMFVVKYVGAGRGDDVDLQRHARSAARPRSRRDRRVDPLVEMDLVTGVQEDAEERVAQATVDDLVERAARLADAQRAVPLGDRLEVRPDEPIDVVADLRRQLRRIVDDETRAAVQRTPDAERDGEPIATLDPAVARAEQSERCPVPLDSIRWHERASRSIRATRRRHPRACRARVRTAAAGRRARSGTRRTRTRRAVPPR